MKWFFPAVLALSACTPEKRDAECGSEADVHHFVVTTMGYMRSSDGVSSGFDLDGTEYAVCGVQDLEGPDGEPGIDNGLSYLIPALEASEAKVVEGYINTGILEGRILLVVSVSRVDSLENDSCVDVAFNFAQGDPLLGTDGGLLPGQTLMQLGPSADRVEGVEIKNGQLTARPLNVDIPVSILDSNFELNLRDGGLRMDFLGDGDASGFFTGAIHRDEITEILASSGGVDGDVVQMINTILGLALDLEDVNGECNEMSVGLVYTGAEIYLLPDETE
ncbi:MAG: hypothetical protein VXW32_05100 [Myxococcota bacterium]|nr:hypothetical protein [Myxococcota bacterium]